MPDVSPIEDIQDTMIVGHHPVGHHSSGSVGLAVGLCLVALSCSDTKSTVLVCTDATGRGTDHSWVLRVDTSNGTAEMIVHVPSDSIARGTPAGNRHGTAVTSDRAYEITIPGDSGGTGDQSWVRLQFQFEVDRYTGAGTLWIGEEKHGERAVTKLRCELGSNSPRL